MTAQVLPWEAAKMSKAILLWRTAFLMKDISVYNKDKLHQLSFSTCWLNFIRASICTITSLMPTEGTPTADKWSYLSKTEHVHLDFRKGTLATSVTVGQVLPCTQGKPRVPQPSQRWGSHGPRLVTYRHWVPFWGYPLNVQMAWPFFPKPIACF